MNDCKNWLAWIACVGMICPAALFGDTYAESSTKSRTDIRDVAMGANNSLAGRIVNSQGQGVGDATVQLTTGGQPAMTTTTDQAGYFKVTGVKGGLYQVSCQQAQALYRIWSTNTAPPSAKNSVMLVQSDSVLRGQCAECGPGGPVEYLPGPTARHGILGLLANPWIVGAAVAVAIAVPLALDNDAS